MFLLDTDTATLAYHNHPRVVARAASAPRPVRLAVVTRLEILRGRIDAVLKAATADDLMAAHDGLARSERFLAGFAVVPITPSAAAEFERLKAGRKFRKKQSDLLTGCVALAHDATLVTRNVKDFQHVPGLRVENWAD